MRTVKTQVVFPEDILEQLDKVVSGRKRSEFIVLATEKELARQRFQASLNVAAGAWSDKDHPHLNSSGDIQKYLHTLRSPWSARSKKQLSSRG